MRQLALIGILLMMLTSPLGAQEASQPPSEGSSITVAPISIMAQPPEEEFKNEFDLPPDASAQLKERRNRIDQETARLNQIADSIQVIMDRSDFDSSSADIAALQAAQESYRLQLLRLDQSQEDYRGQRVNDVDGRFGDLPAGAQVTEGELSSLD